jgi:hypothetical protein
MIHRKILFSIPIYGIFLVLLIPYVYASNSSSGNPFYDDGHEGNPKE